MRLTKLFYVILILLFSSCYRDEIQFEGDPPDSYTQVVRIDSVTPEFSTVMIDSFATGSAATFLLGEYIDPYFGKITARPFMEIDKPAEIIEIPESAVYDSLELIIRLNKYYYGDTTIPVTIDVHELDESIVLGYNDRLYNNSNFSVKPQVLGSKQLRIYPNINDSITIRLSQGKGAELFSKLKLKADEVSNTSNFVNYFKGIRIATANSNGVVFGLPDSMKIRLHYHSTIPYPEAKFVDFHALSNSLAFRQILVERTGILPDPSISGKHELPSAEMNHLGFTQPATGVLMKIIFPSLRNILSTGKPLNLLHAELIIRPLNQSFNNYHLPPYLTLAQTDESNFVGGLLGDSTGEAALVAYPVIDRLYGVNNYYRFNVTGYINQLLNSTNTAGTGFFVMETNSEQAITLNRAIFGDARHPDNKALLVLSVVTVNID